MAQHAAALASQVTDAQWSGLARGEALMCPDILAQPSPLFEPSTGAPALRFIALEPVCGHGGRLLGILGIADVDPRELDQSQRSDLRDFAALAAEALSAEGESKPEARPRSHGELLPGEEHNRAILEASLIAFLGIDSSGTVIHWNRAAERMLGWTAAETIGTNLTETIIPADHHYANPPDLALFLENAHGKINRPVKLPAVCKDGTILPVEMTISNYAIGSDKYFGAFLQDLTERRHIAAELERKQSLLDAVLDSVDVGVVACNAQGSITLFNKAAAELHGVGPLSEGTAHWAQAFDVFGPDGVTPLALEQIPLYRALAGEVVVNAEMTVVAKGRAPRFLFASGQRLLGSADEPLGAVVALKDVTALKASETQRALNESRLRAITENLPSMIGHVDRDERVLFLNDHGLRFYGVARDEILGQQVQTLYSEQEYLALKPFMDNARAGRRSSFENQIVIDGAVRHFYVVYIPDNRTEQGVCGFYVMATDITARKKSEIAHEESEERLRVITDNLPVLIAYIDRDEVFRFANATHERWYGVKAAAMIGRTVRAVFGPDNYSLLEPYLKTLLAGQPVQYEMPEILLGTQRSAEVAGIPDIRAGEVVGAYLMTTDITATRQHEAQLQLLARSDSLTGLANRRSYEERLGDAVLRSVRSGRAIALLFLDVDFFKQINDTAGHAGGDEVLKQFAHRLSCAVRSTDTVCRLAGDEFTIILEGLGEVGDAMAVGDKILALIREPFQVDGEARTVTTSIGIAFQAAARLEPDRLPADADAALYRAKKAGRNRYEVSEG